MAEKYTIIKRKVKKLDDSGNPIKNSKGNFVYETIEQKYRVDADYVPTAIDDICSEFIDNYVDAHNEGEWFVSVLEKKETYKNGDKKGQEKEMSFVSIRSEFVKKFFPNILKGTSKKELSFRERMLEKYKK